jgi:hypothetical protein
MAVTARRSELVSLLTHDAHVARRDNLLGRISKCRSRALPSSAGLIAQREIARREEALRHRSRRRFESTPIWPHDESAVPRLRLRIASVSCMANAKLKNDWSG